MMSSLHWPDPGFPETSAGYQAGAEQNGYSQAWVAWDEFLAAVNGLIP